MNKQEQLRDRLKHISIADFKSDITDKHKYIRVTYLDGARRYFDLSMWVGNRRDIIKNLHKNDLCTFKITYARNWFNRMYRRITKTETIVKYKK